MKRHELFNALAGLMELIDRARKSEALIIEGYQKEILDELRKLNNTLDKAMKEPAVKVNDQEPDLFTQEQKDNKPQFTDRKPAKGRNQRNPIWIGLGATYSRLKAMGSEMSYTDVKNTCIDRKMVMRYKEPKKGSRNHGNWYLLRSEAAELEADIRTELEYRKDK